MIWALLVRNPLASALGALFVALGIYTTFLKMDNALLKSQNGTLLAAEQRRVMLAESALRENAAKEATDKKRSKQIEAEYARSKKAVDVLTADNLRLVADIERLRHGSGSNPMPENPANPPISADTGSTPYYSTGERLLAEIAGRFDQMREQILACQAYVKGL